MTTPTRPAASPARERILGLLKTRGPQAAAELARLLGVTSMAVRQHLQALASDGLVVFEDERRKLGRPARIWRLAAAAAGLFPDTHGELAVELIDAVRSIFGSAGLEQLVTERSRRQLEDYRARMPGCDVSIEQRISTLASLRSEDGYIADWKRDGAACWLLLENHCPVCAAATACQSFCRDELAMFAELLGSDVVVTRTEHLLAGARRCAYRIEARGSVAAPQT